MSFQRRSLILVPTFLIICAIAGGLIGPIKVHARAARIGTPATEEDLKAGVQTFTRVYELVGENYADKLAPDKGIYQGAIPGMLRTLDPHSNFLDPKEFAGLKEKQNGKYYGIGMMIGAQPRTGRPMVVRPFGGSPAYKAGIRPGDLLLQVNDKRVDNLSTSEVADLLKGPRDTKVQVTLNRENGEKPLIFNLVRGEIPRPSVDEAFWIKPHVAFLRIDEFTSTTSHEMEENLKRLGESNIEGLILDLRDNPGGILPEGVAVAGHWLDNGQVVVSHKGRAYSERPYLARGSQYGENYPVVVLVNRYSASAAEIVAGALQDHDRGWVLGDTTFGKGLVQTVYPLSDNAGLLLTTQHYYTPSGRLIQRDYSGLSFLDYYYGRHKSADKPTDVKQTDMGRVVYGGGGITPDEKYDTPKLNAFQVNVARKNAFFNFSSHYFSAHETKLPSGWTPGEPVLEEYHDWLMKNGVQFSEAEWAQNHSWLREELRREMYITAFSYEDSQKVAVEQDAEVQRAVDALPKAAKLLADSRVRVSKLRASR